MARSHLWQPLDNPFLWGVTRMGLDTAFGLYQRRIDVLREWGLLHRGFSVLDVGCGIGQYSAITDGPYLGVDLEERYIEYARKRHRDGQKAFQCIDVTTMQTEDYEFDVVLMVDFLHHISDAAVMDLLKAGSRLARQYIVGFEPVTSQSNPIGSWIVQHDRGDFVRPLEELHQLFTASGLTIERSVELHLGPINTQAILARPSPS